MLGQPAQLLEREPYISFLSSSALVIKQWLLFDPMPESDARFLLVDLRQRLPVVSMNDGASFHIADGEPAVASDPAYDGSQPTLIPGQLVPTPVWDDRAGSCNWDAKAVLEVTLADCPPVSDERVRAAMELYVTSQYDFLPRSLYLAMLTVLDGLATGSKRADRIAKWIDEKVSEAEEFNDQSLLDGLRGLKNGSHAAGIRALVKRAVLYLGGSEQEAARQANTVKRLYRVRSQLSHQSDTVELDLARATQLTRLVLNAVVSNPALLNDDAGEEASLAGGRERRTQWIAEAEVAIRRAKPDCAAVEKAIRRPLIMGKNGLLIAHLADRTQWAIDDGGARPVSDEMASEWAALDESFGERL
ncbi:hypothetical protein [Paraburkholderia sp. SIMBA_027]|uniref:hypothetical protein n=1 Tax=Paraburkholderia sp. SIMBA_027 TaxID=3085770 RepID=UPI0039788847